MKTFTTIGLAALTIALVAAPQAARAASIHVTPENGVLDTIDDAGGCGTTGCIPLGLSGYTSLGVTGTAPEMWLTPGTYRFTYLGNGDAADSDTFTVGGHTIHSNDPIRTSFVYTVAAAGDLPFTYANLTTGYSISNSAVAPSGQLNFGFYGVKPWSAYIGLADLPYPGDHDFQDLGIRVSIPESPAWAMMLVGFAGLGYAAFRSGRARPAIG
jgi:hypothetical protein